MAGLSSRVFTIAPSTPFLPTLISALVEGRLVPGFAPLADRDPLALARATLYLPTFRAGRLARDIFLDALGGDAAMLPRIVALGDIDEDELAFAEASNEDALATPDAIGGMRRRMLLAQLILAWAARLKPDKGETPLIVGTPATALALADDLARLIDDMTTRQVKWDRLDGLVPDAVDEYWQLTLKFLTVAREFWPGVLEKHNAIEPAARRDRLIAAEAKRITALRDGPVIAAGSTGSMPATAALLATIAGLQHGAVVLPGLDTRLEDGAWEMIGGDAATAPSHPQFAMQGLLARIGITRAEVQALGEPASSGREALASEAMRPADATDLWRERLNAAFQHDVSAAFNHIAVIEAAHVEEEALAIAIALREAMETPGRTAALVTPDRALARRVSIALGRWDVAFHDSRGEPLEETPAAVFARLAAEVALGGVAPTPLLALLKHSLLRLGDTPRGDVGAHAQAVATLEYAVLRGPRPKPGSTGLAHALATFRIELAKLRDGRPSSLHGTEMLRRLDDATLDAATTLVVRLGTALAPLEALHPRKDHPFAVMTEAHRQVVAALSADENGEAVVFAGHDGEALADAFDEIAEAAADGMAVRPGDYEELFRVTLSGAPVVRRPEPPDVRLHIYGPLEARLTMADLVVLGGLVESVWPPAPKSDPWLSRPMRRDLGLDLPERRIGLSAHDFAQMLGAPSVILTCAAKVGGAPAIASRFLQRVEAVAGAQWERAVAKGSHYIKLARRIDERPRVPALLPPAPTPPREARPIRLSVTEIEDWLRDPYTIYARHILKLPQLDAIDVPPGAADRGSAIHGAVGDFALRYREALPQNPYDELIRLGRDRFAPLDDFPEAKAFWWPRFLRIAHWFTAEFETARRPGLVTTHAEIKGAIEIPLPDDRVFQLRCRADRIEHGGDGRFTILDFKTGQVPTSDQVRSGLSPQLTLEGAILRGGGFEGIARGATIAEVAYVSLKGGEPAGACKPVDFKGETADAAADAALAELTQLVLHFDDPNTPYRSVLSPMFKHRYGCYDDLARIKEWSLSFEVNES